MIPLKKSSRDYILQIIGRYATAVITLLIIISITRSFSIESMRIYAATLSITGIMIWITDLGSTNQMIIESGKGNSLEFSATWANKISGTLIGIVAVLTTHLFVKSTLFNPLLFIGLTLDAFLDSIYPVRQVRLSSLESTWFPVVRKSLTFLSLSIFSIFYSNLTINFTSLVYLVLGGIFLVIDLGRVGKTKLQIDFSQISKGLKIWSQFGGHAIAGLDLYILSGSEHFKALSLLISSKRITNTLAIPATLMGNRILHDLSRDTTNSSEVYSSIKKLHKRISIIALAMSITVPYFSLNIFDLEINIVNFLFQSIFIFTSSILAMNILLNNILIANNQILVAARANYLSGVTLISSIIFLVHFNFSLVLLSLLYMCSNLLELVINHRSLKNFIESQRDLV